MNALNGKGMARQGKANKGAETVFFKSVKRFCCERLLEMMDQPIGIHRGLKEIVRSVFFAVGSLSAFVTIREILMIQ